MEKTVNLHLRGLYLRHPPHPLPTCTVSMADWQAGYSENIEWKAFSIQPVSQSPRERGFGWGVQPGFGLWSPGVMTEPRAEKSGESLPQACFSIYPRFRGKSSSSVQRLPFSSIFHTHKCSIPVCQLKYISGLHGAEVEQKNKTEQQLFW